MKKEVLILNYHNIDVGNSSDCSELEKIYSVKQSSFEKQIRFIADNKIPVVSIEDIIDNRIQHPFSVAITVDDGNNTDYSIIYPFLKKFKIRCTFFLITGKNIDWEAIDEMHNNGFSIGSHGVNHIDLTTLSNEEIVYELIQSKKMIENNIKTCVNYFSFPYGMYNKKIINMAIEAGYKALFTTDSKINNADKINIILHRLTVKTNTSFESFAKLILNRRVRNRKARLSTVKNTVRTSIGSKNSDKLNLLINSKRKK